LNIEGVRVSSGTGDGIAVLTQADVRLCNILGHDLWRDVVGLYGGFDGLDRQPHSVYETDYTVTIPIQGNARLDFYTIDGDHHQVTNNGTMTVPELRTPQPYNGNFLEFTVLDVTRAN
jgi:hypothetical protein